MISLGLQHFKFLLIVVPRRLKLQPSVWQYQFVLWFCIICFRGLSCYWLILCFLGILLSRPSWEAVLLFFFLWLKLWLCLLTQQTYGTHGTCRLSKYIKYGGRYCCSKCQKEQTFHILYWTGFCMTTLWCHYVLIEYFQKLLEPKLLYFCKGPFWITQHRD